MFLGCCSWIQRMSTSTWRTLLSPTLCAIPMAAVASMPMLTIACFVPESPSKVTIPRPYVDARTIPYCSDSPELFATTSRVFELERIRWFPNMIVPPAVDLRDRQHPAQLASEVMSMMVVGA